MKIPVAMREHKGFGVAKQSKPQSKGSWCCFYLTYDKTTVHHQPAEKRNVRLEECLKAVDTLVFLQEQEAIHEKMEETGTAPDFQFIQKLHQNMLDNIKRLTLNQKLQGGTGWIIFHQSEEDEATAYFDDNVEEDKILLRTWLYKTQQRWEEAQSQLKHLNLPQRKTAVRNFLGR